MKRVLYHPFWTHLPAVVLVLVIAAEFLLHRWVFQNTIPIHFTLTGEPDRWGQWWQLLLPMAIFVLAMLAFSIFCDELWARQERRKSFNWISLFDEFAIGVTTGLIIGYFQQAFMGTSSVGYFPSPLWSWLWLAGTAFAAVAFAALLELMRPHRSAQTLIPRADTSAMETEMRHRVQSGERWVYWEQQNPRWMSALVFAVGVLLVIGALYLWGFQPWLSVLLCVVGLAFLLLYGGMRVLVTNEYLIVRLGILGLRLLSLPISVIAQAEVHEFSPLQDFGGYGIRFNREMKAFFFHGNRGVKISTATGKHYLIGSDTPEQLAVVIQAVQGHIIGTEGGQR